MRVLLSTYGSRGDVEPMVGLAVRSRALGAEVRGCAPPDFAELLARVAVPLVPVGRQLRPPVTGTTLPTAADLPRARDRAHRRAGSTRTLRRLRNVLRRWCAA
jgi:vancomycin aglycone glucosyltransferase